VCLRKKEKLPEVHKASCSEIGDDIWAKYLISELESEAISVECDMTKCSKTTVEPVTPNTYVFHRTTNVCDAGWQSARSNKFEIVFGGPTNVEEASFEVLL